jgi:hypothetical protein
MKRILIPVAGMIVGGIIGWFAGAYLQKCGGG